MNSCNRLKFAARLARTLLRDRRSPVQPRHAGRAFFFPEVLVLVAWLAGAAWPAVQADAPITMRVLQLENGQLRVEWDGGQPPYRVQACTENSYGWVDISDYIFGYSYTGPAPGDYACLRVRTAPDFQPPFPPEDLTVHAVRCDRVALGWDQARDDADGVGVLGYRLYRDGVLIIELADPATFFLDRHVLPSKSYSYTVTSFDWLGNESARSTAVLISTPPCLGESGPGREVTLMWD